MEVWMWAVIGVLAMTVLELLIKIDTMRKAAREIGEAFGEKIAADTNTLIDISTGDPCMRRLAAALNDQLRSLREAHHRYAQGDLELKEAVTGISHDLRTPLTAICGYLDLLEREETNEKVTEYLSRIRNRTEALKNLTEELFRYSVVTSLQELKREPVDLVGALEESLLSFCGSLEKRGIRPQIRLPEAPVRRQLDPGAVNRIFSNIIGNALKYSDGDLEVCLEPSGTITFSNLARGLDPVAVGRLFDRFYTVEAGRNSTGLGLSIAKILTQRQGGHIEATYRDQILTLRLSFPDGT